MCCVCLGLNSAEMYDPRVNEWRYVECMSTRRSSVGVGVVAGMYIYLSLGGITHHCHRHFLEGWEGVKTYDK